MKLCAALPAASNAKIFFVYPLSIYCPKRRQKIRKAKNILKIQKNVKKDLIFCSLCVNIVGRYRETLFPKKGMFFMVLAWYHYVLGAVLLIASIIIVVLVMLQQSKQAGLSGAIAGGADTFLGKNKGRTMEAKLAKYTKIIATVFMVVSLAAVILFAFLK